MRRIIRVRVSTSIERARPELENYIAQRLQFAEAFPYAVREAAVTIREVHELRVTPLHAGDFPRVDIQATLRVTLAARTVTPDGAAGPRRFDLDVELTATGTIRSDGTYRVAAETARVSAWWPDVFR